jgi:hypothetical protein
VMDLDLSSLRSDSWQSKDMQGTSIPQPEGDLRFSCIINGQERLCRLCRSMSIQALRSRDKPDEDSTLSLSGGSLAPRIS